MAQKAENYIASGKIVKAYPANSTTINSGDLVEQNQETGRIIPLTLSKQGAHNFVGVSDDLWTANDVLRRYGIGSTAFANPATVSGTEVEMLSVQTMGMFQLAISDTSGTCGETVFLATATSGAQVFTVTQPDTSELLVQVGVLAQDFSGATANDVQKVIIFTQYDNTENSILYFLRNHVVDGMHAAWDASSHISFNQGIVYVNGIMYSHVAGVNTLVTLCAAQADNSRVVLYVVNSAGAIECIDTATNLFLSTDAQTATALQDSAYWPSTSFLIFGAGFLGSNSVDFNAGAVRSTRRSITDVIYRRFIN